MMTVTVTPENWPGVRRHIVGATINDCEISFIGDVILTVGDRRYCFSPQMTNHLRGLTGAMSLPEDLRRILRQANLGVLSIGTAKGLRI